MNGGWDLTALINAADAKAGHAERHLWLARLTEWLRHEPRETPQRDGTPLALLRLRHLLQVLDQNPALRAQVQGMLQAFWRDIDAAALLADFGFGARLSLRSELLARIRRRLLPGTPDTTDLAALFPLLFDATDGPWLQAMDQGTLARVAELAAPAGEDGRPTRLNAGLHAGLNAVLHAVTMLASAVRAAGFSPLLRQRMSAELLADEPFRQLAAVTEAWRVAVLGQDHAQALLQANMLRATLDSCLRAAASVKEHLEACGVSVDIVYELDQMAARAARIELLIEAALAPEPIAELRRLLVELVRVQGEQRGVRALLAQHYSMLARQVAERSAETGEHYITRDRAEYGQMLRRAAGGGAVIAGTTFLKFGILLIGLSPFWGGFWNGVNYAGSFVIVMLLHWTVATKQPAMTAPALAASLPPQQAADEVDGDESAVEVFVERVAQIIRSQAAGIFGNVMVCGPLVLALQLLCNAFFGATLVTASEAHHVLGSLTLLGPTALFAAFTGVLLFASSLIAGWTENWFVFHRVDSAIAWNPRIVARLGAARARRWAAWWRANISGLASNVSLGMMLGLVPPVLGFVGLPIEARHVTLGTGQLAAALGTLGFGLLSEPAFWWCVAGIVATGVLNLSVSFGLAFQVALRSRGVRLRERGRISAALWRRLRNDPLGFILPPKT